MKISPSQYMRGFSWLSALAACLTFPLIIFGALVRLNDAGLACPDWPLCFGQVTPLMDVLRPNPAEVRVALEVGHRYVAGLLGALILLLFAAAWRSAHIPDALRRRATLAGVLLLPQVVLGGLTVLLKLHALSVALHLVFGILLFAALTLLATQSWRHTRCTPQPPAHPPQFRRLLHFTLCLALGQVFLGGLVSGSNASMACVGFPTCNGSFAWPPFFLGQLQYTHRLIGVALAAALLTLAIAAHRTPSMGRQDLRLARALVALVLAQILLGWYNVAHIIPTATAAAHTAIAAALIGLLAYLADRPAAPDDDCLSAPGPLR